MMLQVETSSGGPTQTANVVTDPPASMPSLVLQNTPQASTALDWDAQAPITLVVAPAGHRPGIYHLSAPVVIKETAGAGIVNWTVHFNAPGVGATQIDSPAAIPLTVPGVQSQDVVVLVSDGTAAITWTGTPLGATPPVLIDVYATALIHGLLPP